jgi:hypothetical protein
MIDASPAASGLFTDLYELSMMQAYVEEGMDDQAVFSLTVRRLPATRNYLLACGIDTILDYLENLRFSAQDLTYVSSLGQFSPRFLDWLGGFRFSGDIHAMAEGTPVFANEPILEIAAPIAEAQLIETFVLNQIHLQTVLASKAVRVVTAAQGRPVVDFGARRMHGTDAAVKGARAFHIAGVASTSNVLAGHLYGLPVSGTMAHSYVQAHDDEITAFRAFARLYPETTLLVDTYNTLEGVHRVVKLAKSWTATSRLARSVSIPATLAPWRNSRDMCSTTPAWAQSVLLQAAASMNTQSPGCWPPAHQSTALELAPGWGYRATPPTSTSLTSWWTMPERDASSCRPENGCCPAANRCSEPRPMPWRWAM